MSKLAKALTAAAGNAGESLYVEDVFSTYLYTGNGTTQYLDTGQDLYEGGMRWVKGRSAGSASFGRHFIFSKDAEGSSEVAFYDGATASAAAASTVSENTWIKSDGTQYINGSAVNTNGTTYVNWSFRKAEKFFDVVTWTGDGTGARTISHSLNGTVGALFMKATNAEMQWFSYHNGLTNAQFLELNATTRAVSSIDAWNNTTPTSSEFTVGSYGNISGRTYVAYLFASDAGGFGDGGDESIIKCGSFVPSGGNAVIDVGFEPQWLLVKAAGTTSNWVLQDSMRGWPYDGNSKYLRPNLSNAEDDLGQYSLRNNGFIAAGQADVQYIYIAIRRPMKTPESGTEVFAMDTAGGTAPTPPLYTSGFPVDFYWWRKTDEVYNNIFESRLTGQGELHANTTNAEGTDYQLYWDTMTGARTESYTAANRQAWMFKRATGFMDVVAYTGDGVAGKTVAHNLGVAPEMMIVKNRSGTGSWVVYHSAVGSTKYLILNQNTKTYTASVFNNTDPTAFEFSVGVPYTVNQASQTYIAYLFATLAGVSKVGSYTGTGANLNVDCGFSAGARFILIKRTDSTGDWYVWDSARGIVAGNDPYLLLNSTAAEVTSTDYIDPLSSGFTVTSSAPAALNASGGTYIFLAIA